MSIEREITIRILSNKERFSDLFFDFAVDFWLEKDEFKVSSLDKEDVDDYDYKEFDILSLKSVLDYRQSKNYNNYLNFFVKKIDESIILRAIKLNESYSGYSSQYELSFSFGIGRRIKDAERHTDFSFYLSQILPRLAKIDCKICEIKCHDYDF